MAGRVARRSLLDLAGGAAQAQPARPARLEEAGLALYGGPPERLAPISPMNSAAMPESSGAAEHVWIGL